MLVCYYLIFWKAIFTIYLKQLLLGSSLISCVKNPSFHVFTTPFRVVTLILLVRIEKHPSCE